jgi:hypothetical protein
MEIGCERCGVPVAIHGPPAVGTPMRCDFCGKRGVVTGALLKRAERERQLENWRMRLEPWSAAGAIGVVAVTVLLLLGMYSPWPGSEVCFWLLPGWMGVAAATAILLALHDRAGLFRATRRTLAGVLLVLALPILWEALPRPVRSPHAWVQSPARAVARRLTFVRE